MASSVSTPSLADIPVAECIRCNGTSSMKTARGVALYDEIERLYFQQGWKLPRIRKFMHRHRDFHSKERHYKTQLHKSTQYHSKRLRKKEYEAMAVVAQASPNQDLVFTAFRGARPVNITLQQIHKELARCRNRDRSSQPSTQSTPSISDAQSLLIEKNIRVELVQLHSSSFIAGGARLGDWDDTPSSPDGSDTTMSVATPVGIPSTPGSPPMILDLIGPHALGYSGFDSRGLEPAYAGQPSIAGMYSPNVEQTPQEYENRHEYNFLVSTHCLIDPPRTRPTDQLPTSSTLPLPLTQTNRLKQKACNVARQLYRYSFLADGTSQSDMNMLKRDAIRLLKESLKMGAENQYAFPCLNEVATVLATNEKWPQLEEFLKESDTVIDSPMATPFRYAFAALFGDIEGEERYGGLLKQTHDHMEPIYGLKHPNILVNSYYWAWHQLEQGHYESAIHILEHRVGTAERILGDQNLMIVNGMVMLGRAYAMTDRHEMACWKYKLALRSLYNHHHLRAYRLTIQLRLAVSEAKSNRFDSARIKMNEVINGRIEILGYSSEKTCAAIETFNDMLKQFGRADEASQMYAHHAMEYDRQQQRQWYKMEGFSIPAHLLGPSRNKSTTPPPLPQPLRSRGTSPHLRSHL